jgi:hypothetical protein
MADQAIDQAILSTTTTSMLTRPLASNELLLKYITVRGLKVTSLNNEEAQNLYSLGGSLGFFLLDGPGEIVYLGPFELQDAKEIVFRTKLMLQSLMNAYKQFMNLNAKSAAAEAVERTKLLWSMMRVEVLVSPDVDRIRISDRILELTMEFDTRPWRILTREDLEERVREEYERIGDL